MSERLQPAPATRPGEVIDAHLHLFSVRVLEEVVAAIPQVGERFERAIRERKWSRRGVQQELPDMPPDEMAAWYSARLRDAGVAKGLVVSIAPESQYYRDFIAAASGHIHALTNIDPRSPDAPALLEREMAAGFKGVKLLPVNRQYRVSDPGCRPFFEKAAELGAPMIIHYGVTVDPLGDLRYGDPLDLSPVARDFPDLPFVIAHFGAGFFPQVLQLAYQCGNVCVDSSGTNNWMDHMPYAMTLEGVFGQALSALGPERVLFGTDSGTTAPYRSWIKYQQMRTLEILGASERDRDLVLRGNAVRIFGMDD